MTLNHNCGYFSGVGSGIAGNGSLLYFSSGKINPSNSEIPNFYKYKQIIEFNPITAIE